MHYFVHRNQVGLALFDHSRQAFDVGAAIAPVPVMDVIRQDFHEWMAETWCALVAG